MDADSAAKQVVQRPESPLKQARTDSSEANLPHQTLSAALLHSGHQEDLCSANPYLRMPGLLTTPVPPLFSAHLRYHPSSTVLCGTSEILNPRTSDPTGRSASE
ncbi:hypothetical protein KC19_9G133000 [Ceratodon purpureus]|uniref:Uncharacterized protein n=1 Tax=Ceratodon purpureus TaxID=3225 RepID=A0A8T0GUN5_CERPU|nr:hypothetical protein KC19_9G133000 [Ceratodon purpureus]